MHKPSLHPRNRHQGRYDLRELVRAYGALGPHVLLGPTGEETVNFADPAAVLALNAAVLCKDYGISHWSLPQGALCPPIPGRADYVHHLADLIGREAEKLPILDVGTGASAIYPLLGCVEYGWRFVGTDIDEQSLAWAKALVARNEKVAGKIEFRLQRERGAIFSGIAKPGERFDACLCNPPFHASAAEAAQGTQRKLRGLAGGKTRGAPTLNFAGQPNELWTPGGEFVFIRRMITESAAQPSLCGWFTTLVSKSEHLAGLQKTLASVNAAEVRIVPMAQGQKRSRFLAWRF